MDDELLTEFRQAQRAAKAQGQHLPLTVTRQDPTNPTTHRPTVEREVETFRKQRVVQNTAADVVKGIGRANSIHGGFKSLLDGIGAGLSISRRAEQQLLDRDRLFGEQGMTLEQFKETRSTDKRRIEAFKKGQQNLRDRNKNNR